jgi:hypothetical protein
MPAGRDRPWINFFPANHIGNARAKAPGKKVAPFNYLITKIKHGVGGIFSRKLTGLFCQDFLQCVKPVREWINRDRLEAYPGINFRL